METLGLIAGCFTTLAFLPQVIKTIREKHAGGLSWGMTLIYTTGIILWVIYGIMRNDYPIIIANSVSIVLNVLLILFKLKYRKKI